MITLETAIDIHTACCGKATSTLAMISCNKDSIHNTPYMNMYV